MNSPRYMLVLPLLLFFGVSHAMKRATPESSEPVLYPATVEAYFVPQNPIGDKLSTLLDTATREVLVAMYWITEYSVIDKLIFLKQKEGISVKIIIDETSQIDLKNLIDTLSRNQIMFLIYPSRAMEGIMHDKFVVVDGNRVFTGSANLTKKAFNLSERYNHENIVIIHSNEIARRYQQTFSEIENETIRLYIGILADNDIHNVPDWLVYLLPRLPQDLVNQARISLWNQFDQTQQNRLKRFLGLQEQSAPVRPVSILPATPNQKNVLSRRGYSAETINRMSLEEASKIIGNGLYPNSGLREQPISVRSTSARPISQTQINILIRNGYPESEIEEMSYQEAYEIIGELMQGSQ